MKVDNQKFSLLNSYSTLPSCFYERIEPTQVKNPKLIYFNKSLAKKLKLDFLNEDTFELIMLDTY